MKTKLLHAIIATLLFLVPIVNFSQAPTLGTAANFVLFTSVGAITNTGPSQITGDVGSNSGAGTGFGNVNGTMHSSNAVTGVAAADLLLAYGQLNTTTPAFFPASPLGNGATLTAGVYSITGNTILSNTLTLNAQGTPTAVFIFLINGTFASNANAMIVLSNGAQACNVFWKVEGAVGLATGSTLRGTIIANNAAISISASVTLEGRALSTNGAISINQTFAYTPVGCGSPLLTGPAAPSLASTACYAIFSANGPVSNTGVTTVTGDVGSNVGLTTGYVALSVSGSIHAIPDVSTAQAALDLGNIYTYLNSLPTDITLLFPAQFGNDLVLTPHTYLMGAAVSLTNDLYLNAQGNANAIFVIKVNGAFSTSVNSKIILINGTQAKNVFWKIDGALSIAANSISKGTWVVNNGAILLATAVNLDGRILTTTGALGVTASTVSIPPVLGGSTAIPNQTVCAGTTVTFVSGLTGGTTYQWRKGTTNLINGGSISGATSATLTINPAATLDAATNYNVVISGGCASNFTSTNITLVVNSSPIIAAPVPSQTICAGSSVTFTVAATGTNLTYQWRDGNVALVNNATVTGVSTATLNINPASASDASSSYNLIISGSCAPDFTSTNISLVVQSAPTITAAATDQIICAGNPVIFSVGAPGSGLTYQWRIGTTNLTNGANISGATSATLVINPANAPDASTNYNVIVTGACAPDYTSTNTALIVNASPTIAVLAVSQTVCAGTTVNFNSTGSGNNLTYQWRKGTVNVVNGGNVSGANTATLSINPVNNSDVSTVYNLVITGDCAPGFTSANIGLSVNASPTITAQPASQTVCVGSPVNFSAASAGTGLTYQWRIGAVNLSNGGNVSGATSAVLMLSPVKATDSATDYNVVITGVCAPAYTSAAIELLAKSTLVAIPNSNSPVCTGSVITLSTETISGGTYEWTGPNDFTSNLQNPEIAVANDATAGNYSLVISTAYCTSTPATVLVAMKNCVNADFFIPEGFSPNNDGINDLFVIRGISNYPDNKFEIFNRWGSKVFEANPYQNTWDGTATEGVRVGGNTLPVGTYFYVLNLGDGSPFYKGTIYLNR